MGPSLVQGNESPEDATIETLPGNNILATISTAEDPALQADCWDKTFKVRVTSKKTGKKVDLNITFKNSGVVNP